MPAFPITPFFPILGPAGLLPLPTRYRIYFGEPLEFQGNGDEDDDVIQTQIDQVKSSLIHCSIEGFENETEYFAPKEIPF